jgi:hypothetical protein
MSGENSSPYGDRNTYGTVLANGNGKEDFENIKQFYRIDHPKQCVDKLLTQYTRKLYIIEQLADHPVAPEKADCTNGFKKKKICCRGQLI